MYTIKVIQKTSKTSVTHYKYETETQIDTTLLCNLEISHVYRTEMLCAISQFSVYYNKALNILTFYSNYNLITTLTSK